MKSVIYAAIMLSCGIQGAIALSPKSLVVDVVSALPEGIIKGFGAAAGKEAKSVQELATAAALVAAICYCKAEAKTVAKPNAKDFNQLFVKDFLAYAVGTKVAIVLWTALVKEPKKTAEQVRKVVASLRLQQAPQAQQAAEKVSYARQAA